MRTPGSPRQQLTAFPPDGVATVRHVGAEYPAHLDELPGIFRSRLDPLRSE
jgi:hypothetical protein